LTARCESTATFHNAGSRVLAIVLVLVLVLAVSAAFFFVYSAVGEMSRSV